MASDHVGKEVFIATDEGKFYGTIHSIDVQNKKLILQKVSTLNGTKMRGLQIFFTNEIQDLQLLEDSKASSEEQTKYKELNTGEDEHTDSKNWEEESGKSEEELTAKDPSDDGSRLIPRQPLVPNTSGEECFITESKESQLNDPPEVILVDEMDDKFSMALESMNSQRVIGLSAEGDKISRSGVLSLLVIGCRQVTYVFDVYKLGEECFEAGLRAFLEDCYILKVIHDCRFLSDCLFHQYGIKMKNIFDTQVADIIIYKQKRGKLPGYVAGLEDCIYEYLRVHSSQCKFLNVIFKAIKNDSKLWTKRPIPDDLLNAVAEKVLFLRELRITQMENMLAEFLFGVDVYLEIFRDSNTDYSTSLPKTKKVPEPFYRLRKVTEKRWKRYEEKDKKTASASDVMPGDERKVHNNPEDYDGWTEGKMFSDMHSRMHGRILERDDLANKTEVNEITNEPTIDTGIAPWRLIGLGSSTTSSDKNGMNSTIFKSEAYKREPHKKKNGQQSQKGIERHSNGVAANWTNPERKEADTILLVSDRDGRYQEQLQPSTNEDEKKSQVVQEKKVPLDWFDCDTPSTDRSRTSSLGSESSFSHTQPNLYYEEEFPSLYDSSQNSSPGSKESLGSTGARSSEASKAINAGSAKTNLNGMLGLSGSSTKTKPGLGRAKSREYFAASISPLARSPVSNDMPKPNSIGGKNTHEFPSDVDLLQADPIIKTDQNRPVPGQKMKVQRIMQK